MSNMKRIIENNPSLTEKEKKLLVETSVFNMRQMRGSNMGNLSES
jgi:hypothetical protein